MNADLNFLVLSLSVLGQTIQTRRNHKSTTLVYVAVTSSLNVQPRVRNSFSTVSTLIAANFALMYRYSNVRPRDI